MTVFRFSLAYVAILFYSIGFFGPVWAEDSPYRLGDGDTVRVIAPMAEGLSGTYRLGDNGQIALPVDETVVLGGLTLEEARVGVKAALSRTFKQLAVGLELVERRPFFITGAVGRPGGYPHLSGLTLGEAVALAGGPFRAGGGDALQSTVTSVRSDEEYRGAKNDLAIAMAKAARIAAMLENRETIVTPETISGVDDTAVKTLVAREAMIMAALNGAQSNRIRLVNEQLLAKTDEVATLQESISLIEGRLAKVADDRAAAETDVNDGIVTRDRLEALDRVKDQIRSELQQTTVLLNQARGDRLDLALKADELPRQWQVDLLRDAGETQQRIAQLERSMDAAEQLLDVTSGIVDGRVKTVYSITRDGQTMAGITDASTAVLPGDLVEVARQRDNSGSTQ